MAAGGELWGWRRQDLVPSPDLATKVRTRVCLGQVGPSLSASRPLAGGEQNGQSGLEDRARGGGEEGTKRDCEERREEEVGLTGNG